MEEWRHFEKEKEEGCVPNSSYWYVRCRHCAASKLTGRRSAMRAHLKLCPMYAAQYRMEQCALQAAAAASRTEAEATAAAAAAARTGAEAAALAEASATGERRKRRAASGESSGPRGGRGKHCMMEEWEHFTRLQDEGYIGKSNFFYAVCKHCQRAHDEADAEQKPLLVPEKLVGRREKMRKHLSLCPHFKGDLPPADRRLLPRGYGLPPSVVFSALAGAGGATDLSPEEAASAVAAAAAAAAVVSAPANNGSSRLALDEWHFFTRLERKKDSAYYYARCNFCQQAYENAPESMKASMEPSIVMGRKSNMQTHLSKCLHLPKDPTTLARVCSAGFSYGGGATSLATPLDASVPPPELKRARLDTGNAAPPSVFLPDSTAVHRALARVLIEHHLPFEWVESDSAKQLFRALVPAANELIPTATDFRTRVLDEIHHATLRTELTKLQEPIPLELGASTFAADAVDTLSVASVGSWPVMLHCNLSVSQLDGIVQAPSIEGVVTDGQAIVSLSFVRTQKLEADVEAELAYNHGLEVARWLDDHIRLCVDRTKVALGAVVFPLNTITQRAVGILRAPAHWPQVAFLPDMEDMLRFPLLKLLATAEMFTVVSSLIEVWQLESIRACVMERLSEIDGGAHTSPFCDWESCATLIQVLLDEKTFEASSTRGAANAKRLVENALNRSLLERVYNLLHAFTNAFASCRSGLSLSDTLVQLGALLAAAEGFITVQLALEVVWEQMEQPLFVVAHALNPRLRLRELNSTDITKLSTLSDLSVSYFRCFFGRKPTLLRGEVTAYLHTSQRVFTSEFVAEFPVVDDYFRYLSDNFPSLSMLMQVLHSFSSVSLASRSTQQGSSKSVVPIYANEEQQKLEYLRDRWGISLSGAAASSLDTLGEGGAKSRIVAHNDRSGAAMLNAGVVVDEWKEALESKLHVRGVDFSLLEDKFDGMDEPDIATVTTEQDDSSDVGVEQTIASGLKLPSLAHDDELTFPSVPLRAEFSMKVPLKDLFKTAEATI